MAPPEPCGGPQDRRTRAWLQRAQEEHQILTLGRTQVEGSVGAGADTVEVVDHARRFSTMGGDRLDDVVGAAVVEQEQALPDAPERCGAKLRAARAALRDAVTRADVVHEQIGEQVDRLAAKRRSRMKAGLHRLLVAG